MIRALKSIAKFATVLIVTTVMFSMIWGGLITDTLYNCTDAVGFDYLHPGDWVHGQIADVDHVVVARSMSEPDSIKKGWGVTGLWGLWISFFAVSLVVSFVLARKTWLPAWSAEPAMHRMSAPPSQSRDRGFIGRALSGGASLSALIGDLGR